MTRYCTVKPAGHHVVRAHSIVPPTSIEGYVARSAVAFGVSVDTLTGPSRARSLVVYRQVAMTACRQLTEASLPEIGRAFHRDHTTVMHALRAVEHDEHRRDLLARLLTYLSERR